MSSPENSSHSNSDPTDISAAFECLQPENNTTFNNFDPNRPDNQPITLIPPALSLSREELLPSLVGEKRTSMLKQLGLFHQPLPPEPLLDYSLKNGDGSTSLWQFYSLNRETDGRKIEMVSRYRVGEDNTVTVEEITLLSDHLVELERAKIKQFTDEGPENHAVSQRLLGEFHLGGVVLEAFELSPQEKKSMLAAYDQMGELGLNPDTQETMQTARQEAVAAMLPPSLLSRWLRRHPNPEESTAKYENALKQLTDDFDDADTKKIQKAEQLLRLTELNMQLNYHLSKKESQTRGNAVLAALLSGAFGAGSHKAEPLQQFIELSPTTGALVGSSLGLGLLALTRVVRARKVVNKAHPSEESPSAIQEQLRYEKSITDKLWTHLSKRRRGEPIPSL